MIIRLLIGIVIGTGTGALLGYFGKCTSGTCPLTANPLRGAIIGALAGVLFVFSYGLARAEHNEKVTKTVMSSANVSDERKADGESIKEALIHVNSEADFKKYVLKANLPCLADFFSQSCPPCRMLSPTIKSLAKQYKGKAVVCKVSLDHNEARGLAQKYKISGIPAVLFFSKGKETQRLVGLRSKKAYSRVLDEMIKATAQVDAKAQSSY